MQEKTMGILKLDLRSLAFFRIGLSILVIGDLLSRILDIKVFYSDYGILPRVVQLQTDINSWFFSFHYANGTVLFQVLLFLIEAFFTILLLVGYRTKLSTFIVWLLLTSIHARNPFILDGSDWYLRLLLFWSNFLPLGASYSIDSALNNSTIKIPKQIFCIGNIAIFLQTAFVYWFAVVVKLHNIEWIQGYGVYYSLSEIQYTTDLGWKLVNNLPMKYQQFLSHLVIIIEVFAPALLFAPAKLRYLGLLSLFFMQIGFGACLDIEAFPFVSTCALLPFLPASLWDKLINHFENKKETNLTVYYDGRSNAWGKIILIVKTLFLLPKTQIININTDSSTYFDLGENKFGVIDPNDRPLFKSDALYTIFHASPLLSPLLPIIKGEFFKTSIDKFCMKDHENSMILNDLKFQPIKISSNFVMNIVVVSLLIYCYCSNVEHVHPTYRIPDKYRSIGSLLHIDQWWFMFASLEESGEWYNFWLVIPGTFKDGSTIDFFNHGKPVSWNKPEHLSNIYKNRFWKKFLIGAGKGNQTNQISNYANYLCNEINLNHRKDKHLKSIEFYGMYERILPDFKVSEIKKYLILEYQCPR